MRRRWVLTALGATVVLAAAVVAGGGVYRTVKSGGRVYVVNRFTGSSFALAGEAPPGVRGTGPQEDDTRGATTDAGTTAALRLVQEGRADVVLWASFLVDKANPPTNTAFFASMEPEFRPDGPLPEWSVTPWGSDQYLVKFTVTEPADAVRRAAAAHVKSLLKSDPGWRGLASDFVDDLELMGNLGTGTVEYGWYWLVNPRAGKSSSLNFGGHRVEVPSNFVGGMRLAQLDLGIELSGSILARLPAVREAETPAGQPASGP